MHTSGTGKIATGVFGFMLLVSPAAGQFTTASLSGSVTDASGSMVPGARVTALNTGTGLNKSDTTGANGAFLFPILPVGTYRLTVDKQGFSTYVQEGITLTVNQAANQAVTIQVGSAAQQISVTADATMLNTQTASLSQLVTQQEVVDLPLNGRTAQSLVFISAGTANTTSRYTGQGGVYPSEQEASVSGGGTANVNYLMDGAGHTDTFVNMNLPFPNPDAIQEFNLQSNNMSAEYGSAAAVVDIITKSGTNSLHGSAFEFVRNGDMNARNYFSPTQDTLKRNQFGGAVGGPIKKDQLFYFGTYQGTRSVSASSGEVEFVPTAADRAGNLSDISKQLINPNGGTPLPGNQIPLSLFAAPAQYFLGKIPLPNGPGERLTFQGPSAHVSDDQFLTKVDWVRGKNQLSGRYFYSRLNQPPDTNQVEQDVLAMDTTGNQLSVKTVAVNHIFTASPNLLFATWFGWDSQVGGSRSGDPTGSNAITFAAAGVNIIPGSSGSPPALDSLNVGGFFTAGGGHTGNFNRGDWRIREAVTHASARHTLIFGGEFVRISQDISNYIYQTGFFGFTGQYSGSNLADFLLGDAARFQQGAGQFQDVRGTSFSMFVQDNWRVTQSLSVNLGLRWDPMWPYRETENRVTCFAPGQKSARYPNAPAGLIFGGDPGCPADSGYTSSLANFAPRLGFAYRIGQKTVIRGGAGIYYTQAQTSQVNGSTTTAPFNPLFNYVTKVSFVNPYQSVGVQDPFPADYGAGSVPGANALFTTPVTVTKTFGPNFSAPTLATWNLRVERQLGGNWLVSGTYAGNDGYHLSTNQLASSYDANSPIYIPGASTAANELSRRPYANLSTVGVYETAYNSHYDALQLNLEKRFTSGLALLANYTWSKFIDNFPASTIQTNPHYRDFDYGLSKDNIPYIFHFTALWTIPAPGLRKGSLAARALTGWELSSITTWQSGFDFSVLSGVDNSLTGGGVDRADFIGGASPVVPGQSHGQEVQEDFNTSLFVHNALATFGDSGKNILRGPRLFDTDMALIKSTNLTERSKVQFRAEFFNAFNNVNFAAPGNTVGTASFGKITSALDPRILQLSLKVLF